MVEQPFSRSHGLGAHADSVPSSEQPVVSNFSNETDLFHPRPATLVPPQLISPVADSSLCHAMFVPLPQISPTVCSLPSDSSLFSTLLDDSDLGWGNKLTTIDEFSDLRVVYQNVNGLSSTSPDTQFMFEKLRAAQCSIFLASETNINWHNRAQVNKFKEFGNTIWPNHRLIVCSHSCGTDSAHKTRAYLPGGCAIWVNH